MNNEQVNADINLEREEIKKLISLYKNKNIKEAENQSKLFLIKYPKSFFVYNLLGIILTSQNKNQEAIKNYENALKIKPDYPEAYFNLGIVYKKNNNLENAKTSFINAIKMNSKYIEALNNLGLILKEQGKFEEAIEHYQKALQIKPDYIKSINNLGLILKEQGKFEEAIEKFKLIIKLNPKNYLTYNNLGNAYKDNGNYHEAISCYEKALELNPEFNEVHNNLANAFNSIGEIKKALLHFKKSKDYRSVAQVLECLYELDEQSEYQEHLKHLCKINPLNRRVSAISAYVACQNFSDNPYDFCKNPLDFIKISNVGKSDLNLNELEKDVSKLPSIWNLYNTATKSGYHTVGNLFKSNFNSIAKLEQIIKNEIELYKNYFSKNNCGFITSWPTKTNLTGWCVSLSKSGHLESHIHPSGWLSGVFYLKMPKKIKGNEGYLEFSLHGHNYKIIDKNLIPTKVHPPNIGDIALFPSSLFHRTIPFDSLEARVSIAFDLMPIS